MSITVIQLPPAEAENIITRDIATNTTTNTTSGSSATVSTVSSPIEILGDNKVRIHGEQIMTNRYYPFNYKGKKYLLFRPDKNVTEIYQVKE